LGRDKRVRVNKRAKYNIIHLLFILLMERAKHNVAISGFHGLLFNFMVGYLPM
jgi:hypothetical protein